jgi:FeS assembly protein IscX
MSDLPQPARIYWDATYEIVLALMDAHPTADVERVGMEELYRWIIALPNFADDPELANEEILNGILREWYEEVNS